MGGIGRFVRTTAFRLAAIYLVVFVLFAGFLIGYFAHRTSGIVARQFDAAIESEIDQLRRQYQIGGLRRLVAAVDNRTRRPGAGLYLVTDFSGNSLAGNITDIPTFVLNDPDGKPRPIRYQRLDSDDDKHAAIVRVFALEGGFRVVVGRDVTEREAFREMIRDAIRWSILVMLALGLVTWFYVRRRVLARIDQVTDTSRRIMGGDMAGRLPVAGTGDEFDRLAVSLNQMLERIGELMSGLKDVSDNIAHDLKTPLTRLRNRVEGALAGDPSAERYREALEATIEESDRLIATFNALLLIARVEAGSTGQERVAVDLAEVVRDVVELYEPAAEEVGVTLKLDAPATLDARAVRELVAQAVVNLVDNALKYGRPTDGRPGTIRVALAAVGDTVRLTVADDGPGVPEADRERVLGRFVRLEASRSTAGSGLGLSLAAAVARLHGGTIVLGDAGPGLSVTMEWPRGL